MTTRYKATRPDGTDFHTGTVDYGQALASGQPIIHRSTMRSSAADYFSVATAPTACTGMAWPCRLFEVATVDEWTPEPADLPHKRATHSLTVVAEVDAHITLGGNGRQIAAIITTLKTISFEDAQKLGAAWDAQNAAWGAQNAAWGAAWGAWDARNAAWDARNAAWNAAWNAARGAARGAAWDARGAAWGAILALLMQDRITPERYATLTSPWISVMGETEVADA